MASTEKTALLGLSKWLSTDKPKRDDFVSDNVKIDTVLGGHIADAQIHLSEVGRERTANPISFMTVAGSGNSSRSLVFDFEPIFAVVFAVGKSAAVYEGEINKCYFACAAQGSASAGISLDGDEIRIYQNASAANGVKACLNESGVTYIVAAFR
jgi:hypothetical protein